MRKRYPIKFSDLIPSDERISIEPKIINKRRRWIVQLSEGTAISANRARYLSKWLLDAADFIEDKEGKVPVE